jgi:hypothetical protein
MWTRLCVDIDAAGNVCGASWELHDADGVTREFGTAPFGPFDTPSDVLATLAEAHLVLHGRHDTLF